MTLTPTTTSKSPVGLLADTDPTETVVVSIRPPPPPPYHNSGGGRISQTTEHLLIAAGSIGRPSTVPAFRRILTHPRCNHYYRHDCARFLHHAEARPVVGRYPQAKQGSRRAWWLIRIDLHLRLGQEAKARRRLQFDKKSASISSACCSTHSTGLSLFAINPADS
jgi:hypothetical protein